jgi:hypothetical protein
MPDLYQGVMNQRPNTVHAARRGSSAMKSRPDSAIDQMTVTTRMPA